MWLRNVSTVGTVSAASPTPESTPASLTPVSTDSKPAPKLTRPSQLSIYDPCCCPHKTGHRHAALVERSALEDGVRSVRIAVVDSLDSLKEYRDRATQIYDTGKAHSLETVAYLREDANVLARVGAISVGGLTGLIFGIRGGFFKKLFYGSMSMSAVASICYPKEATDISKGAYTIAKYYAIVGFNRVKDEFKDKQAKSESKVVHSVNSIAAPVQQQTTSVKPQNSTAKDTPPPASKLISSKNADFGQSNPKDRDMYSTRS